MRKIRVMYKKLGSAVYISHLDIMRTFQRSFKRAGIAVKHTEGFNPHPYISIALPLSLGYNGECEFLDTELLDDMPCEEIVERLNSSLPEGIEALIAYEGGSPVRNIAYSEYEIVLEYDNGIPEGGVEKLSELFYNDEAVATENYFEREKIYVSSKDDEPSCSCQEETQKGTAHNDCAFDETNSFNKRTLILRLIFR